MRKSSFSMGLIALCAMTLVSGCGVQTGAPSRPVSTTLTTQQLSFNLRESLLRQLSNPAQGNDCLNSSCSLTATQFSGPSATNRNRTLRMAYAQFGQWYLLVAPMQGDPLSVLQGIVKRPPHFPFPSGVAVVRGNRMDYYWLNGGREYTSAQHG